MRTWTFPIRRKRPVFMPAWARVFGWTALALSPIAILQREPLALAGTIVAGALLFLYGLSRPHDPNYMRTFPYEFVGDLEIRPSEIRIPRPDCCAGVSWASLIFLPPIWSIPNSTASWLRFR